MYEVAPFLEFLEYGDDIVCFLDTVYVEILLQCGVIEEEEEEGPGVLVETVVVETVVLLVEGQVHLATISGHFHLETSLFEDGLVFYLDEGMDEVLVEFIDLDIVEDSEILLELQPILIGGTLLSMLGYGEGMPL